MILLFHKYSESFGINNIDFPDDNPEEEQAAYEQQFRQLICEYSGHDIGPDQCGQPEHDLCYLCGESSAVIERSG